MLIKCPECEVRISDKALICPHCGYPINPNIAKRAVKKSNKRRRLPNGFGSIMEIKNQYLRKPFRASITVGKTPDGKYIRQILKPQGYFETYNEAYEALLEYNRNPYDLDKGMTVLQLYEKWSEEYFKTLGSDSSIRTVTSAWAYCSSIYDMRVVDVRARHIKGVMDEGIAVFNDVERTPSPGIKTRIKSIFNKMLDYAIEYEIVDKNYARTFNVSDDVLKEEEEDRKPHIPFTNDEIKILWDNIDNYYYVDVVLFQCYTGWRPQELGLLEMKNVDLDNWIIVGGIKSEAGTDRPVPIHPAIRDIVTKRYNEALELGSRYLLNCADNERSNLKMTYEKYRYRFTKIIKALDLNREHRPHDPRSHFITLAKKYDVDEYALKYIVGHAINDITEKVYTHRDNDWLMEEIMKIEIER